MGFRVSQRGAALAVCSLAALGIAAASPAWAQVKPLSGQAASRASAPRPAAFAAGHMTVVTSGEDQCSLPIDQRSGAWVCLDQSTSSAPASTSTSARTLSPGAIVNGSCNTEGGCWFVRDQHHAHDYMSGEFGYNKNQLGKVRYTQYHSTSGPLMTTRSYFRPTTSIRAVEAEGQMLYGRHTTIGTPIDSSTKYAERSRMAAGDTWFPFNSTDGYKYSYKNYVNHANVIEVSWKKGTYTGYWYVWLKSPIAVDPDNNNSYTFKSDTWRYLASEGAGWRAG